MPRFLSRRKFAVAVALAAAILLSFTPFWPLAIVFLLLGILAIAEQKILKHTNQMDKLYAVRETSLYDGLVIGDTGASKQVKRIFCHGENILSITAPGRTLEASFRILQHVVSIVPSDGVCVIVDAGYKSKRPYSLFDIPYFSLVTRKELKVEDLIPKSRFPFIYAPAQIIRGGIKRHRQYVEAPCPDRRIVDLCHSHEIRLIYLSSSRYKQ